MKLIGNPCLYLWIGKLEYRDIHSRQISLDSKWQRTDSLVFPETSYPRLRGMLQLYSLSKCQIQGKCCSMVASWWVGVTLWSFMFSGFPVISMCYLYNWEANERNVIWQQCAQWETIFKEKCTDTITHPNVNSCHCVGLGIWVIFLFFSSALCFSFFFPHEYTLLL